MHKKNKKQKKKYKIIKTILQMISNSTMKIIMEKTGE